MDRDDIEKAAKQVVDCCATEICMGVVERALAYLPVKPSPHYSLDHVLCVSDGVQLAKWHGQFLNLPRGISDYLPVDRLVELHGIKWKVDDSVPPGCLIIESEGGFVLIKNLSTV